MGVEGLVLCPITSRLLKAGLAFGMLQNTYVSRAKVPYLKGATVSLSNIWPPSGIRPDGSIIELLEDLLVVGLLLIAAEDQVILRLLHVIWNIYVICTQSKGTKLIQSSEI